MSIEAMSAVLHHSRSKGTAKLVLLGIANHEGDGGAWPAIATLARYANVTPRNVQKALYVLANLGELVVHQQKGGPAGLSDYLKPNLYAVAVRCPADCDGTAQHRTRQTRLAYPVSSATPGVGSDRGSGVGSDRGSGVADDTLTSHRTHLGITTGLPLVVTSPEAPRPVDKSCHREDCQRGWLGEDDEGRRVPCLTCKPHLRRVVS